MSAIIELRQYTLKPGKRDTLIELFDREFVENQEAVGMELIGQFRDADNPDRFVWLRGFPDMDARAKSLAAFYGGPVWKAHRNAANDTMIDSDNVLLLRPAWNGAGFANGGTRGPRSATVLPNGTIVATICSFDAPVTDAFFAAFRGMPMLAALVTEGGANTFPALPVREGENVLVLFTSKKAPALPPELQRMLAKPPEILRLRPTARSRLHG
jgi:NIPSNAP